MFAGVDTLSYLIACIVSFFSRSTALAVLQEDILMCRISFFIFVCALFFWSDTQVCVVPDFFSIAQHCLSCALDSAPAISNCGIHNFVKIIVPISYRTNIVPYQYRTAPLPVRKTEPQYDKIIVPGAYRRWSRYDEHRANIVLKNGKTRRHRTNIVPYRPQIIALDIVLARSSTMFQYDK